MDRSVRRIPKHPRSDHAARRLRLPAGVRRWLGTLTGAILAGLAAVMLMSSGVAAPLAGTAPVSTTMPVQSGQ